MSPAQPPESITPLSVSVNVTLGFFFFIGVESTVFASLWLDHFTEQNVWETHSRRSMDPIFLPFEFFPIHERTYCISLLISWWTLGFPLSFSWLPWVTRQWTVCTNCFDILLSAPKQSCWIMCLYFFSCSVFNNPPCCVCCLVLCQLDPS